MHFYAVMASALQNLNECCSLRVFDYDCAHFVVFVAAAAVLFNTFVLFLVVNDEANQVYICFFLPSECLSSRFSLSTHFLASFHLP